MEKVCVKLENESYRAFVLHTQLAVYKCICISHIASSVNQRVIVNENGPTMYLLLSSGSTYPACSDLYLLDSYRRRSNNSHWCLLALATTYSARIAISCGSNSSATNQEEELISEGCDVF